MALDIETVEALRVHRKQQESERDSWGAATLLLEAGVHPKVVQERPGHAEIEVTLDIYSHVVPSLHEEAADLGAALLDDEGAQDQDDDDDTPADEKGEDEAGRP